MGSVIADIRGLPGTGPQIIADLANGDDKESTIAAIVREMALIGIASELRSAPIRVQCLQRVLAGASASVTPFDKSDLLPHHRSFLRW